jgi:hypothetical protein
MLLHNVQMPKAKQAKNCMVPIDVIDGIAQYLSQSQPSPIQHSTAHNLVFTHKDRKDAVFASILHGDIQMQFNSVMVEFYSQGTFRAQAVGKLWGGDIRITVGAPEACATLLKRGYEWAHHFSDKLDLQEDNFLIIIHGIPTSFEAHVESSDTTPLLEQNATIIPHCEFIH